MKQSGIVIVAAVLMLSACGDKSEVESTAVKAPPPSAEPAKPIVAEQAVPRLAEEKVTEESARSPAAAMTPAPAEMEKPAMMPAEKTKTSEGMKGESLSREEGLALAEKSGCLVCHKIETKLVGPAWRDVSKRYKGDAGAKARLITSVKAGSKGNWTDVTGGIPMPPNSPRVSDENIEKLVSFILSQ